MIGLFISLHAADEQAAWKDPTVQGFSIYKGQLDYTEGFGAYLDIPFRPMTKNFDNGGGSHDYNTQFLREILGVENIAYDPYQRPKEQNEKALELVAKQVFDTATSNSVLNVIDTLHNRLEHILLSCEALKKYGAAYFKVFDGNHSSEGQWLSYGYQANQPVDFYQKEVEQVFGAGNVVTDQLKHMIIAYKNSGCKDAFKKRS